MKQSLFESRHQAEWQAFGSVLDDLEQPSRKSASPSDFSARYRRLCNHLALAADRGYSSHLVDTLQHLAMRGHQQLYRHRGRFLADLLGFILAGFPRQVRAQWPFVAVAAGVFCIGLALSAALVYRYPNLIYALVSPEQVASTESMYNPDHSRLGPAVVRLAGEDWMMFGYYVMNNIGIAFQMFAGGLLLGVGSLFYLLFNGVMIGAVAGHLTEVGYGGTFWSFVVGHSAFELTALVLAGAAGLRLGWALIAPGQLTRGKAVRDAAKISIQLVYGVVLLLLIAAFIEAYWSSKSDIAASWKYVIGAILWLAIIAYLVLAGRSTHAPD